MKATYYVALMGLVFFTEFLLSGVSPLQAQQESRALGLIPRLRWAQLDVILGRIQAVRPQFVSTKSHCSGNPLVGNRESLTVSARPERTSLHYESVERERTLTVDFAGPRVRILQQPAEDSDVPRVLYQQLEGRPIVLEITDGEQTLKAEGETLWHLLLTRRRLCQNYLLPILEELHPRWKLLDKAERVEEAMVRIAGAGWMPNRPQWDRWIAQLASGNFAERQAADRQLREAGQAIARYLDGMDLASLDAEQRLRIRRIRQALKVHHEDRAEQVASWLIDDHSAWMAILAHPDPHKRVAAVHHLQRICGEEIEFDPRAAPAQRQAQLSRLLNSSELR